MQSFASLPEPADLAAPNCSPTAAAPHGLQEIRRSDILIADDDARDVELMRLYLQLDGFECLRFADSVTQILPLALEQRSDLILLSVRMPQHSGLQTLNAIRRQPELADIPVVVLTSDLTGDAKLDVLRSGATDLLSKPLQQAELLARTRSLLGARMLQQRLRRQSRQLEETVRQRTSELEASHRELVQCLARAAEFRDDDTGHHIIRVGRYARVIGEELGLSRQALDVLESAAQLHDVGKIGIPDRILLKPGKLTAEEYDVIRKHCGFGKKIIEGKRQEVLSRLETEEIRGHAELGARIMDIGRSPLLSVAKRIALTHHEHWDGSGYPVGLAGEDIPLEGRITAVADVFDALSSKRPYKSPFPLEKCFRILEEGRGTQFDPSIIDAFMVRRDNIIQIQIDFADVG